MTEAAVHVIPSLNSPVYLVCDALVEVLWLLVYVIQAQPAEREMQADGHGFESHLRQLGLFQNNCLG